jgi:hypothetical protein
VRVLVVLAVLALAARGAHAGGAHELAEARRLKQSLDFAGALAEVERVIAAGNSAPDALLEAYRLAGELAAGLGRDGNAITYFQRLLALDPGATMPSGTSPKILAPFETARSNLDGRSLVARVEGDTIVVVDDPLGMVATVLPRLLLDRHGNTLFIATADARPVETPVTTRREIARPPAYARWEIWTLVTVGFAASAAFGAEELDDAQDEWNALRAEPGEHDFSELEQVEQRGRSWATTTNIMLGATAVTGTIAAICLWRELRRPDVDDTVTVTGAVTHGGAAIGIAGRF